LKHANLRQLGNQAGEAILRRREFITLAGSAAAAWPLAARAQQPAMPVVGYLNPGIVDKSTMPAFHRGLPETGYVEGKNVTIEYRWANGRLDQVAALAADLVDHRPAVIVAIGSPASPLAVRTASATVPIVFTTGIDPVAGGLVASLNHPDGNLTGMTNLASQLVAKQLEVLRELLPGRSIAFLINPTNPANIEGSLKVAQAAAPTLGLRLSILRATSPSEIAAACESLGGERAGALLVSADTFFLSQRDQFIALAARFGIPTMYAFRMVAEAGGLISYGSDRMEEYRQIGTYVGRILKGEKSADLPVVQPRKYELVINLKAAKALGLEIPPILLARADAVIE
jgi:putative ABC transport system substrate-binding protein